MRASLRVGAGVGDGAGRRRSSLGGPEADPRVEDGVEDVGDQRHDEVDDADHEHARRQQRDVLLTRRLVDEEPMPW